MTADQILAMRKEKTVVSDAYAKRVFFSNIGLPDNGTAYVVCFGYGESYRESQIAELKEQGFRYNGLLKAWFCRCPAVGVKTTRIDFNELIEKGRDDIFHFKDMARSILVELYMKEQEPQEKTTGFVGEVGERVSLSLTFTGSSTVPSNSDFGDFTVLYFVDDGGNRLSWFQRTYSEETLRLFMKKQKVKAVDVHGTVKRQSTRLGVRYTDLTKCEITANGKSLHDFAIATRELRRDREERV